MSIARWIITLSWLAFFAYWIAASTNVKRTVKRESVVSRLIVFLFCGGGCVLLFSNPRSVRILPQNAILDFVGSVASLFGLAILLWARRTLAGNWSATVALKENHELIQNGPYRFVRHPIYSGFLLMCLAAAIVYGHANGFLGFVLVFIGFWYKLRQEEKLMTTRFPDEYSQYKSRVKALVPWTL